MSYVLAEATVKLSSFSELRELILQLQKSTKMDGFPLISGRFFYWWFTGQVWLADSTSVCSTLFECQLLLRSIADVSLYQQIYINIPCNQTWKNREPSPFINDFPLKTYKNVIDFPASHVFSYRRSATPVGWKNIGRSGISNEVPGMEPWRYPPWLVGGWGIPTLNGPNGPNGHFRNRLRTEVPIPYMFGLFFRPM